MVRALLKKEWREIGQTYIMFSCLDLLMYLFITYKTKLWGADTQIVLNSDPAVSFLSKKNQGRVHPDDSFPGMRLELAFCLGKIKSFLIHEMIQLPKRRWEECSNLQIRIEVFHRVREFSPFGVKSKQDSLRYPSCI